MPMGSTQLGGGYGFLVPDREIMPVGDPLWQDAPEEIKDILYAFAENEVVTAKRTSLLLGESARGGNLVPIHPLTKLARRYNVDPTVPPRGRKPYSPMGRAIPEAPPLLATGARARSFVLLRAARVPGGVWGYWDRDPHTGQFWGQILAKHRRGFVQDFYWPNNRRSGSSPLNPVRLARQRRRRGVVPVRDVFGLPMARVAVIRGKIATRWRQLRVQLDRIERLDPAHRVPPSAHVGTPGPLRMPTTGQFLRMGAREIGSSITRRVGSVVERVLRGLFRR